jgi:hypothetical protein
MSKKLNKNAFIKNYVYNKFFQEQHIIWF